MAELGDDDFDEGVEAFWRLFAANLGEIAKQKTITLWFPRVEFTGGSAAGYDLDITGWRGSIAMYIEADGVAEETSLEIGFLELFTLPLNAQHRGVAGWRISRHSSVSGAAVSGRRI